MRKPRAHAVRHYHRYDNTTLYWTADAWCYGIRAAKNEHDLATATDALFAIAFVVRERSANGHWTCKNTTTTGYDLLEDAK